MSEKLLPCPFCGGEAKHNSGGGSVYGRLWWAVGCENCNVVFRDREVWNEDMKLKYEPKECFERWNTRHALPALKEALEVNASILQALTSKAHENEEKTFGINGKSISIGKALDMANAALALLEGTDG